MSQEHVAVTIVGGGPIGLTMGLLLGRFGIPAVILERNATTTDHPKARGCFARTMELFRVWGVDKACRTAPIIGPSAGRSLTCAPRGRKSIRSKRRCGKAWWPRMPSRRNC
jgi:2-polyprenyl-6-methoxyphenol hydroxylase-like FAD-dependent oxidoreductase